MPLQENAHLVPQEQSDKKHISIVTPILTNKKNPVKLRFPDPLNIDLSGITNSPKPIKKGVSFNVDDDLSRMLEPQNKRNFSIPGDQFYSMQYRSLRNVTFPPFIPDDPERPHLSSRTREKERHEVIKEILVNLVQYKREDWSQEKMNSQTSIFDKYDESHFSRKVWGKLA